MILLPYFQNFSVPAGLITYPLTFFISDFITEIYGAKKAKEMVHHAFGMSLIAYLIIKIALILPSPTLENQKKCLIARLNLTRGSGNYLISPKSSGRMPPMKILIQRVTQASVEVGGKTVGSIGPGVLVFATPLYEQFIDEVRKSGIPVACGIFGAEMKVSLINDGPITIMLERN